MQIGSCQFLIYFWSVSGIVSSDRYRSTFMWRLYLSLNSAILFIMGDWWWKSMLSWFFQLSISTNPFVAKMMSHDTFPNLLNRKLVVNSDNHNQIHSIHATHRLFVTCFYLFSIRKDKWLFKSNLHHISYLFQLLKSNCISFQFLTKVLWSPTYL